MKRIPADDAGIFFVTKVISRICLFSLIFKRLNCYSCFRKKKEA